MSSVKRATAVKYVSNIAPDICCPFFDREGQLHVLRQSTGAVLRVDGVGNTSSIFSTGGQPSGALFHTAGFEEDADETLYIADLAHTEIMMWSRAHDQHGTIVNNYDDRPFKGPHSLCVVDSDIFFTDSGALGETGLHAPQGSVFLIGQGPQGPIFRPISLNNLAYPTGIAVTNDKKFIYVAEMMQNRVLRYFQQPAGVYHGSVFYTLSGGVGPSALVLDHATNQLYVAQYDVRDSSNEGTVLVLSSSGKLLRTISIGGPEISGLAISDGILYITEKSTESIYKIDC